ncbi:DUF2723 domain-containing protein [Porphyromonas pogonae]|uniref:glycosyltransferase family 117 protein n=1 Tax=Porphyromonas pogonae TaxID=867595 RepID=UPI002E771443|nr:DUF2723 domain-containing protein [Porphyromonas pogonae]
MNWKRFNLANNLLGWLTFVISSAVYLLTIGPTASLWDCAEFIACVNKLEVGHPPGTPFFMLVYNIFSNFTSDPTRVAVLCNATSAILSGFTILLLFWTITHMARRVIVPTFRPYDENNSKEMTMGQGLVILGSGLVGAMLYTFTDSFWFSAVEAEVYAFSSFFTALVFWMMFKWEDRMHEERADIWIILIAYFMGLSIGVHLLNLLCIPAMALVYYYRRFTKPTAKGAIYTILVSFALIIIMMYGIVQGVPKVAGVFDIFAVNTLGLSFNSGLYIYLVVLGACLVWAIYEMELNLRGRKGNMNRLRISFLLSVMLMGIPFFGDGLLIGVVLSAILAVWLFKSKKLNIKLLHTIQLCLTVIVIGFSSYGVILVRAVANTPMNENDPSNAFALRKYLAREQYGSKPLVFGPTFASRPLSIKETGDVISSQPKKDIHDKDKYVVLYKKSEYEYSSDSQMLFPRVFSSNPRHIQGYNIWMDRAPDDYSVPSFGDNLMYFFKYQVNYMYWRYFMWNFAGRQNDIQGDGGMLYGNAFTGIPVIDRMIVGNTNNMPDDITQNKGHNVYYLLPLLLGILGIVFQLLKGEKGTESFWVTFFLFFMTGLAIVVYLNQTPGEPRERDYAYAGSFYAFAIWIGFGVAALWELLQRAKLKEVPAAILATVLGLIVPIQMAGQNWDDHDRSGRTIARDLGINYLESCDKDAVLFCFGDNDTFPLWYIQDVEGVRTDVHTANLSYLGSNWYIDQKHRQAYNAKPLPLKYMNGQFTYYNDIGRIADTNTPMDLDHALAALVSQNIRNESVIPSRTLIAPVNKENAIKHFPDNMKGLILNQFPISLKDMRYVGLDGLAVLDVINANQWKRPIYWTISSPRDAFTNLPNFLVQSGYAVQLLPIDLVSDSVDVEPIDVDKTYDLVMNKFRYGGAEKKGVYFDYTCRNSMYSFRSHVFAPLAKALLDRGDKAKAQAALKKCLAVLQPDVLPHDRSSLNLIQLLFEADMKKEAEDVARQVMSRSMRAVDWFFTLDSDKFLQAFHEGEVEKEMGTAITVVKIANQYNSAVLNNYIPRLEQYTKILSPEPDRQIATQQPSQHADSSAQPIAGDSSAQ